MLTNSEKIIDHIAPFFYNIIESVKNNFANNIMCMVAGSLSNFQKINDHINPFSITYSETSGIRGNNERVSSVKQIQVKCVN